MIDGLPDEIQFSWEKAKPENFEYWNLFKRSLIKGFFIIITQNWIKSWKRQFTGKVKQWQPYKDTQKGIGEGWDGIRIIDELKTLMHRSFCYIYM